jgi:hypothetical protein|tara:strand:+ start:645 stop:890 length:246 start_codon:yes stop_codon:yes gene_type:complete
MSEVNKIYISAGLTQEEIDEMPSYISDENEEMFYDTTQFNKLYELLAFQTSIMPTNVAKARTDTPDDWILNFLESLLTNAE